MWRTGGCEEASIVPALISSVSPVLFSDAMENFWTLNIMNSFFCALLLLVFWFMFCLDPFKNSNVIFPLNITNSLFVQRCYLCFGLYFVFIIFRIRMLFFLKPFVDSICSLYFHLRIV